MTENASQALYNFIPIKSQSLFLLEKGEKKFSLAKNILPIWAAKVSETFPGMNKYLWDKWTRLGGSFNWPTTF